MFDHKEMFIMATLPGGSRVLGTINDEQYKRWMLDSSLTICIHNPKMYTFMPMLQSDGTPAGHQISVIPLHPAQTKQEMVVASPCMIEFLGKVEKVRETWICDDTAFWDMYVDTISRWDAAKANLVAPTAQDMARLKQ